MRFPPLAAFFYLHAYHGLMPELPDITVYVESIATRVVGAQLQAIELAHPFLLRTVAPPASALIGHRATEVRRIGKRIAIGLEGGYWIVIHLMIAGRLHWLAGARRARGRGALARFVFDSGMLTLTEAGSKRRACVWFLEGEAALAALDPGGLEVLMAPLEAFAARLRAGNHTLKRALSDPHAFSGIGNAYSDEILHRARLSPLAMTGKLEPAQVRALFEASREVLSEWTTRLRAEAGEEFPEGVTAFREGMAVHGRYGKPCPVCGTAVQRIRYAANETNYCPRCQTGGRVLADRALSRLLKDDWPRDIEELERR